MLDVIVVGIGNGGGAEGGRGIKGVKKKWASGTLSTGGKPVYLFG